MRDRQADSKRERESVCVCVCEFSQVKVLLLLCGQLVVSSVTAHSGKRVVQFLLFTAPTPHRCLGPVGGGPGGLALY